MYTSLFFFVFHWLIRKLSTETFQAVQHGFSSVVESCAESEHRGHCGWAHDLFITWKKPKKLFLLVTVFSAFLFSVVIISRKNQVRNLARSIWLWLVFFFFFLEWFFFVLMVYGPNSAHPKPQMCSVTCVISMFQKVNLFYSTSMTCFLCDTSVITNIYIVLVDSASINWN